MNKIRYSIFILSLISLLPGIIEAQSTITFQVDMSVQIKDSTFIPSQNSVEITGNQLPFSKTRTIRMAPKASSDSIYTAKVRFPSLVNGKSLDYHFLIKKDYLKTEEANRRRLYLHRQEEVLPISGFNEFVR